MLSHIKDTTNIHHLLKIIFNLILLKIYNPVFFILILDFARKKLLIGRWVLLLLIIGVDYSILINCYFMLKKYYYYRRKVGDKHKFNTYHI